MTETTTDALVKILEKFCNDHELPHISGEDLLLHEQLTDFQFGFLIAYCRIWDALEN
jgi:hypothetical protein